MTWPTLFAGALALLNLREANVWRRGCTTPGLSAKDRARCERYFWTCLGCAGLIDLGFVYALVTL